MIDTLLSKIDIQALSYAVKAVHIVKPPIISPTDDNFRAFESRPRLSLVQINYTDDMTMNGYEIGKIYVNINSKTELSFTNAYQLHAVNLYLDADDSVIHSYNPSGVKLAEYYINRDVLYNCISNETYMSKSTGDLYLPHYKRSDDSAINDIRHKWFMMERLLCYSLKLDGRKSFYIIVNKELDIDMTSINLLEEGDE